MLFTTDLHHRHAGGPNEQTYYGTPYDDGIIGTKFNDAFYCSTGADYFDGKGGVDILVFSSTNGAKRYDLRSSILLQPDGSFEGTLNGDFTSSPNGKFTTSFKHVEQVSAHLSGANDHVDITYADGKFLAFYVDGESGNDSISITYVGDTDQNLRRDGLEWTLTGAGRDYTSGFRAFSTMTITFGGGNDTIDGSDGSDVLTGGGGLDHLTGGAGSDIYRYTSVADSLASAPDEILDFSRAEGDRIDLSPIDTAREFDFIKSGEFTGAGDPELRVSKVQAGVFLVQGDVDGDRMVDFSVLVHSDAKLIASSFIL